MAFGDERRGSGRQMEQARRESGKRMEAARRARGAEMEAARRASGAEMEARRRGEDVADDVQRLQRAPTQRRTLPTLSPRGGFPAQRGRADYSVKPPAAGGGGIAGPLTVRQVVYDSEPDYVETIDGSGLFRVRRIKRLLLEDAEGREVVVGGFESAVEVIE